MTQRPQDKNREDLRGLIDAHRNRDNETVAAVMARLVPAPDDPTAWRRVAVALMNHGLLKPAIEAQLGCVNAGVRLQRRLADDENLLVAVILMHGDANGAAEIARRVTTTWPDYTPGWENLAFALTKTGATADAADAYRRVLNALPDHLNALDGLARCLGSLGEHEEAIALGRRSLLMKADAADDRPVVWTVPETLATDDGDPAPDSHVITYSLWGNDARYVETLQRNVRIARDLYPGWSCRIYHDDTVPEDALANLAAEGARLLPVAERHVGMEGVMWRFLVADDPSVRRYLVRDADSLLTVKERVAVDDWLRSGKPFHLMRDWYSHTDLILAGLWGGTGGLLTGVGREINDFLRRHGVIDRKLDQIFLADLVWPSIRNACCTHDGFFGCFGAKPFPPFGHLPPGHHVGQNASVHGRETA